MLVLLGQHHGDAQSRAAGDDGDFVQRQALGQVGLEQADGVPGLVHGGVVFLFVRDLQRAALAPPAHFFARFLEIVLRDDGGVLAGGDEGGLVDEVGEFGAGEAGGGSGDGAEVGLRVEFDLAGVHAQDLLAAGGVGQVDGDLAVEATGAQQGGVEHVDAVGRGDDDDVFVGGEAVHLDEQGVERLLALVVPAADAVPAVAAHGVNFVDEDEAWGVLLGFGEHVAHAAGADADEHFNEVRARDGVEGDAGFARDGARQQGLARAGRADHQHALGDGAAEVAELARVAQEFDDFPDFFLGFGDAGDVFEGDFVAARVNESRAAAGELARAGRAAALHAEEEEEQQQDNDDGQQVDEDGAPGVVVHAVVGVVAEHFAHLIALEAAVEVDEDGLDVFAGDGGAGVEAVAADDVPLPVVADEARVGVRVLAVEHEATLFTEFGQVAGGPEALGVFDGDEGVAALSNAVAVADLAQLFVVRDGDVEGALGGGGAVAIFEGGDGGFARGVAGGDVDGEVLRVVEDDVATAEVALELVEREALRRAVAVKGEGEDEDARDDGHQNPHAPVALGSGGFRRGRGSVVVLIGIRHGWLRVGGIVAQPGAAVNKFSRHTAEKMCEAGPLGPLLGELCGVKVERVRFP